MTKTSERTEQLQAELDRCRGLVRLFGAHDFGSLEEGIRMLVVGDEPLEFRLSLSRHDVRECIGRIEESAMRIENDSLTRSAIPFKLEILQLALAFFASRLSLDPMQILEQIEEQLLQAMHHAQEKH